VAPDSQTHSSIHSARSTARHCAQASTPWGRWGLSLPRPKSCGGNARSQVAPTGILCQCFTNYSSRIVFSHIPIEFGQTGNSVIRSADPENPILEPNMKWIGRPFAEISPFEISPNVRLVGRSVGPQYILLLTLISYTPLRYVRNVAREE